MILSRQNFWSIAGISFLASSQLLRADLDKETREKKDLEAAESAMDKGDHEDFHDRLIEEGEKTLEEINKLLEQVQKDLGNQQTGGATQAKQKQVTERMEHLIKKLGQSCSKCSSSSSSSSKKQPISQKQGQSQKEESDKLGEKEKKKSEKRQNQKQRVQNEKPESTQEKEEQGKKEKGGKVENDRKEDGPAPESKSSKLADQINEARRWGVLPMKVAETMLFSSGKEAPPEYREIISRYYKKLTEVQSKGR